MDEKHIVAIDLGTSKLALTIAKVIGEDIQVIYYKETPSVGIKYSYVQNPTQVAERLKPVIENAESELNIKITQAVVGMPRYSVRQETNQGSIPHDPDECISYEDINYIKSIAQDEYPIENEKEVLFAAVAQSFSTSEDFQLIEKDIIGMASDKLEGNFKIFIGIKRYLQNIDMVFNKLGIAVAGKYFTPDTTSRAVLTYAEMESGVALIDFGAGVTSVSIHSGRIMRHYAAIPFGGRSVTYDIDNECKIFSESLAENLKLAYGICMPEKLQNMNDKILRINIGTTAQYKDLPVKYLSEVITSRVQEIMEAILYEIEKSGYADSLRSGIVLTGGGANLTNCKNFLTEISGYSVRIGYPKPVFSGSGCTGIHEAEAATSIGMILSAIKDKCSECVILLDEGSTSQTSVILETPTEKEENTQETKEETEQTNQDGTLLEFPKIEKDKTEKSKKNNKMTWRNRIRETIDKFTGTIYDNMKNEGV